MKSLNQQAREAIGKNHRSSFGATAKLLSSIAQITNYLSERYGLESIKNVKTHMVNAYFDSRKEAGIGKSQLSADATAWRQIAHAVGKDNIVPRDNKSLDIRREAPDRYRPVMANNDKLQEIRLAITQKAATGDPKFAMLAAAEAVRETFGLRAQESLMSAKIVMINGSAHLHINGAKGGRERDIKIRTPEQAQAARLVAAVATAVGNKHGSIIPSNMSLKQALNFQRNTIHRMGGTKGNASHMHSQRHNYAQQECKAGRSDSQVSRDLGHVREAIIAHYR